MDTILSGQGTQEGHQFLGQGFLRKKKAIGILYVAWKCATTNYRDFGNGGDGVKEGQAYGGCYQNDHR